MHLGGDVLPAFATELELSEGDFDDCFEQHDPDASRASPPPRVRGRRYASSVGRPARRSSSSQTNRVATGSARISAVGGLSLVGESIATVS